MLGRYKRNFERIKQLDIYSTVQDFFAAFPVDVNAFQDASKNSAVLGEKLTGVALSAAEKSAEISNTWTKQTLAKLNNLSKNPVDPADYSKSLTDFASTQAEVAAENLAAYAEIAKKVQLDTVEVMMAASKQLSDEASTAIKTATTKPNPAPKAAK